MTAFRTGSSILLAAAWLAGMAGAGRAAQPPNIVILLADDMGYGDAGCFNPRSKIATPNIDRLAREGMRFTDAHAPGSVCVPSRYGLLTGSHPARAAHLDPKRGAVIEPGLATVASLLRDRGYETAMVGKWHLGFDGGDAFDYTQPLRGGPVDRGFASFFGQHASLDIPPYFYIANDRCVAPATGQVAACNTPGWSPIQGAFWRQGAVAPDYRHDEVLPVYTRKAAEFIDARGGAAVAKPFFLYVALTAPHTPWLPTEAFRGKSAGGLYGDWVAQVDATAGRVLDALDRAGLATNTLVFFTSDNGPVWYPADVEKFGHSAAGSLRGMKGDLWEGGHRMPFVARWPGRVRAGSSSGQLVCFTDLFATLAALVGAEPPAGSGGDSCSFLPVLLGESAPAPLRDTLFTGWAKGSLAIRKGDWKLIPFIGSGGFSKPSRAKPGPGEPAGQLYNLADDLGETKNLYAANLEKVAELTALLEKWQSGAKGKRKP